MINLKDTVTKAREAQTTAQSNVNTIVDSMIDNTEQAMEKFTPTSIIGNQKTFVLEALKPFGSVISVEHIESAFDQYAEMVENTIELQKKMFVVPGNKK